MIFRILNLIILALCGIISLATALYNIEDPYLRHTWGIILPILSALSCGACIIYNLFQG